MRPSSPPADRSPTTSLRWRSLSYWPQLNTTRSREYGKLIRDVYGEAKSRDFSMKTNLMGTGRQRFHEERRRGMRLQLPTMRWYVISWENPGLHPEAVHRMVCAPGDSGRTKR